MRAENATVIRVVDADKRYGDLHVLNKVSLEVADGEVLVVLGPSGSGKSTLLKAISGLEAIDGGEVRINGELFNAAKKPSLSGTQRAEVGMVFQQFNLYPHMTAAENVMLALRKVKKMPKPQAKETALSYLGKVGLESKADCYPAQLSGGEQQRVAIARSLAMRPKVMLFDEPTSALDVELINEVLGAIAGLSEEGMTMVIVTHEIAFARKVASRIVFFDKGEIVEMGTAEEVLDNPRQARTRSFMEMVRQGN